MLVALLLQNPLHAVAEQISQATFIGRNLFLIQKPGSYCFTEHMLLDEKPIIISTNNVELDLGGNVIDFSRYNPYGILITPGCKNITIKNGFINSAAPAALSLHQNAHLTLSDLTIHAMGRTALSVTRSSFIRINHVTISGTKINSGVEITKSSNVFIESCIIRDITNEQPEEDFCGIQIKNSEAITCNNNKIQNIKTTRSMSGFDIQASVRTVLSQNNISMNTATNCIGIDISNGQRNEITHNEISLNSTESLYTPKPDPNNPCCDACANEKKRSKKRTKCPDGTSNSSGGNSSNSATKLKVFTGINVTLEEDSLIIANNKICNNISSYAAYGLYINRNLAKIRRIIIEKNDIAKNTGQKLQFGIYDGDSLSHNTYINNKVSFHGRSLDGSSLPIPALKKANYYLEKEGPITNFIRESSVNELSFFPGDLQDKNLSIY